MSSHCNTDPVPQAKGTLPHRPRPRLPPVGSRDTHVVALADGQRRVRGAELLPGAGPGEAVVAQTQGLEPRSRGEAVQGQVGVE